MKKKKMLEEYWNLLHQHAQSLRWFKDTGNKFHLDVANVILTRLNLLGNKLHMVKEVRS